MAVETVGSTLFVLPSLSLGSFGLGFYSNHSFLVVRIFTFVAGLPVIL